MYNANKKKIEKMNKHCEKLKEQIFEKKKRTKKAEYQISILQKQITENKRTNKTNNSDKDIQNHLLSKAIENLTIQKSKSLQVTPDYESIRSRELLLVTHIGQQSSLADAKEKLLEKLLKELSQQSGRLKPINIAKEESDKEDCLKKTTHKQNSFKIAQTRIRQAKQLFYFLESECDAKKDTMKQIQSQRDEVKEEMEKTIKELCNA